MRDCGVISVVIVSAIAVLSFTEPSLAKHRTHPSATNGDPCAAPSAYVLERINKIKALQASAPKTNGSVLDMFGGKSDFEANRSVEIAQLRDDADGVNELLAAGGCKSFDLDRELSPRSK